MLIKKLIKKQAFYFLILLIIVCGVMAFLIINGTFSDRRTTGVNSQGAEESLGPQVELTKNEVFDTPEKAVQYYAKIMHEKKFEQLLKDYPDIPLILSDYLSPLNKMSEEEKKQNGLTGDVWRLAILDAQYEYIVSQFGETAWANISFELEKRGSPETKLSWVEKKTGTTLTEEEAFKLSETYWREVAEAEKITIEDIFPDDISNEDAQKKAYEIREKYSFDLPYEHKSVDVYPAYKVSLSFDGKDISPDGDYDFRIDIAEINKKWVLIDGLRWNSKGEESLSDI